MRIAVTGARSRGGAVIAHRLESAGHSVRAGLHSRLPGDGSYVELENCPATECFPFDALRPDTVDALLAGVDAAILILPEDRMIVPMASNLVKAAERAKVERLVVISFLHAGSDVGGPMLRWHYDAERLARRSRIAATCLRPNFYMQDFLSPFKPSPELHRGLISYVDARDVAESVLAVLSDPGIVRSTYSLTGPRAYTVEEVMRTLDGEVGPSAGLPAISWDQTCFSTRRSAHSREVQALCEMWQAAAEGRFSTVTSDVERITGRPAGTLRRFARDHHGQCHTVVSVSGQAPRCA
jgi:uncharacterized protein YbjT (DUF2867 family)